MIGRTNVGGGGGKSPVVTLCGAPGATVSWTGTAAGSAVLSADAMSPTAAVTLKKGNYTFTDSVSGWSQTVAVTGDTAVRLHPAGALYWYGYKTPLSGGMTVNKNLVGTDGEAGGVTEYTNYVKYYLSGNSNNHIGSYTNAVGIDLSAYSQLKVNVTEVQQSYQAFAAAVGASNENKASTNITAAGTVAVMLTNEIKALTNGYVGFTFSQWHNHEYFLTVDAIWLEAGEAELDYYEGSYEVIPKTTSQTLETAQRFLTEDVTVCEIPYAEVANNSGGNTVYVGAATESN